MSIEMQVAWPKVLTDGEYSYPVSKEGKAHAIADGLTGWAHCMMGYKPPINFGRGMVALGKFLTITATADNFSKLADEELRLK